MIYRRTFEQVRESVPGVRRFATTALVGVPDAVLDAVMLLVSELATNAVQHAASPFEIAIECEPGQVRVEISDQGKGAVARRQAGPMDENGRGLQIVAALADAWGVSDSRGKWSKSIWFTIKLPDPEAAKPAGAVS